MFKSNNESKFGEKSLLCESSSSYWQKRLDLLHRSVQSVVNNGTALAAASLRCLNLDPINSIGSKKSIEDSIQSDVLLDALSPNFIKSLRKPILSKKLINSKVKDELVRF